MTSVAAGPVTHLVEVAFKGNRREFFLWEGDAPPAVAAPVVVEADRGEDLGRVHAVGEHAEQRNRGVPHGTGGAPPARRIRRVATAEELRRHDELRAQDEEARRKAMERVKANGLVMKLSDAEWQWDRKKLTLYFTAEKRVDFRQLVRELASMFRARIELKQIGVRDEAKRLDGIGRCGRQYCSASWLPELRPVNLGVAKDQKLSLNPSQISGACGRLMCSLRYEHDFYVQQRKRFPKEGRLVQTGRGEEKVLSNDIFRERVTLRGMDGETRVVPLEELRAEIAGAAESGLVPPAPEPRPAPGARPASDPASRSRPMRDGRAPRSEGRAPDAERPAVVAPVEVTGSPDSVGNADELEEATAREHAEAVEASEATESVDAAEAGDREAGAAPAGSRPPRRRGRRGGRRNRPGGGRSADPHAGGPPEGGPGDEP